MTVLYQDFGSWGVGCGVGDDDLVIDADHKFWSERALGADIGSRWGLSDVACADYRSPEPSTMS